MTDLYRGLDAADIDGMVRNAALIKAAGLSFVMTYLKYTKPAHIAALHGAGLAVGLIFELGQQNALGGGSQGKVDGARARTQASALGAPTSVPVIPTVDLGVTAAMPVVMDYLTGFDARGNLSESGAFLPSVVYACGDVLNARKPGYPWLAGAMGWPGSRDYYNTGPWTICQGTPMRGGHQLGFDWPDLGFEYDPDVARNLDWAWMPDSAPPMFRPAPIATVVIDPAAGRGGSALPSDNLRAPDPTNLRAAIKTMQSLLNSAGYDCGPADGIAGPRTRAALQAFEMGQRS